MLPMSLPQVVQGRDADLLQPAKVPAAAAGAAAVPAPAVGHWLLGACFTSACRMHTMPRSAVCHKQRYLMRVFFAGLQYMIDGSEYHLLLIAAGVLQQLFLHAGETVPLCASVTPSPPDSGFRAIVVCVAFLLA
jgi:hypothetical protein